MLWYLKPSIKSPVDWQTAATSDCGQTLQCSMFGDRLIWPRLVFFYSITLTPRPPSLSEEWVPVRTTSYLWSCSWRPTRPPSSTAPSSSLTADILIHATVLECTVFVHVIIFVPDVKCYMCFNKYIWMYVISGDLLFPIRIHRTSSINRDA